MVKTKPLSMGSKQDEDDTAIVTEENDVHYETGHTEESEIEDIEENIGGSRPCLDNMEDEEQNVTMILRSRKPSDRRKPNSPQQKRKRRYQRPSEAEIERITEPLTGHGDNDGLYGLVKTAIQDMTSQVVAAIQTAFGGLKGSTPQNNTRPETIKEKPLRVTRKKSRSSLSKGFQYFEESSSDEEDNRDIESELSNLSMGQIVESRPRRTTSTTVAKLPAFTGEEKFETWTNRFEAVARLQGWDETDKLQELLPRIQGNAGDFVFDQLPERTLNSYAKLITELKNRYGTLESKKSYRVLFNRRNQKTAETTETYAAELKRIYDKAYPDREPRIRQEDLLQRFLMGLTDNKARIHVELSKDPKTIEEAVQDIITYRETTRDPQPEDHWIRNQKKTVRQVKRNNPNYPQTDRNKGQLNGKRPSDIIKGDDKTDSATSRHDGKISESITINRNELMKMFDEMYEEKKNQEKFQHPNYREGRHLTQPLYRNNGQDRFIVQGRKLENGFSQQPPKSSNSTHILCYHCGQPGHYARSCYSNPNRQSDWRSGVNHMHVPQTEQTGRTDSKFGQPVSDTPPSLKKPAGFALN